MAAASASPGRELADMLTRAGKLTTPAWVHAFATVPRHLFLPRIYIPHPQGGFTVATEGDPAWLDLAYQDEAWVTQIDGGFPEPDEDGRVYGQPTSSSSAPSVMARMLDALDVAEGMRVLEVGTGTGYNAALLCHRLGDANVTSVDIDPGLVEQARTRLAKAGHYPALHVGDGATGYLPNASYDRVIVTCGFAEPPWELIQQTVPGGKLILPVFRSHLPAGVMLELQTEDEPTVAAHGRVLEQFGGFMPTRAIAPAHASSLLSHHQGKEGQTRETSLTGNPVYQGTPWGWFAALTVPDAAAMITVDSHGATRHWLLTDDSWGYLTENGHVTQGGPRRIWDEIEAARDEWQRLGEPARAEFHVTLTRDGTCHLSRGTWSATIS
ncbi:ATP-grasp peptide maturase system methyltransferase [Salinactinospora qingdaonensis]|uniref:Protein-L-isoaspartate O-methyltransferase n=1 Tax=Salinactinospora qingdaonensis TaxID=702744 RepID=A0ABP7FHD8_9ACTN